MLGVGRFSPEFWPDGAVWIMENNGRSPVTPCPPSSCSVSSAHGRQQRRADVKLVNTDGMALIGPGS
jgi:hypothetical protein